VVEQWPIPAGGFGKAIVLTKPGPTEAELRMIGDQLRKDTQGDKFAFVYVFDDERAARNRRFGVSEKLSPADQKYYESHLKASYIRNGKTGFHELHMMPQGVDGPMTTVSYR
jgi:hypothetical protein